MNETNEARERKKTGDWRDAIGVLKDYFPDGMKSEDMIWCQYAGMELEEFMLMQKGGINPREYESTIAAYNAWLWEQSERPEVVEAVRDRIKSIAHDKYITDRYEMYAQMMMESMLQALIGPKGETT